MKRSNLPETRNPVLKLVAMKKIENLPAESKSALRELLLELGTDATGKAEYCWRKHKAPMAAYWKAVAVYSRHIAKVLK